MFYVSDINGIQSIHTGSVSLRTTDSVIMVSDLAETARLEAMNPVSDAVIANGLNPVEDPETLATPATTNGTASNAAITEDAVVLETPIKASTTTGGSASGIAMVSSGFVPKQTSSEGLSASSESSASRGGSTPYYKVSPVEEVATGSTADFDLVQEHVPPIHDPYRQANQPPTQRKRAISARQIMSSPVVTLLSTDLVITAWKLFHERRFRHLPVVSAATGRLVGIVSDRDFLALGLGHSGVELSRAEQLSLPLTEIMKTDILTCRPQTEVRAICEVMFAERIGSMPVVDESGELVGILTGRDILKTLVNRAPLELWT